MPVRVEDFRGRLTGGSVASAAAGVAIPSPFDPHVPAGRFRVGLAARFARLEWRRPLPLTAAPRQTPRPSRPQVLQRSLRVLEEQAAAEQEKFEGASKKLKARAVRPRTRRRRRRRRLIP